MSTIIGIVAGFICVVISIMLSGKLDDFFDGPSVFVVFGGVISATMASFPFDRIKNMLSALKGAFVDKKSSVAEDIEMIVNLAYIARRDGLLALEEQTTSMEDPFLKKGIMLVVDGSDPELIQSILETDLAFTKERHADSRTILDAASAYSPAFGMIGTLIGLINMLTSLSDMAALGPNMSVALVTTFYGSVLANLVFGPLSKKLKATGSVEYLRKELILEGILSIQNGENPRIIREKLNAFLAHSQATDANKSSSESSGGE